MNIYIISTSYLVDSLTCQRVLLDENRSFGLGIENGVVALFSDVPDWQNFSKVSPTVILRREFSSELTFEKFYCGILHAFGS